MEGLGLARREFTLTLPDAERNILEGEIWPLADVYLPTFGPLPTKIIGENGVNKTLFPTKLGLSQLTNLQSLKQLFLDNNRAHRETCVS
jgi:hypothetical protein